MFISNVSMRHVPYPISNGWCTLRCCDSEIIPVPRRLQDKGKSWIHRAGAQSEPQSSSWWFMDRSTQACFNPMMLKLWAIPQLHPFLMALPCFTICSQCHCFQDEISSTTASKVQNNRTPFPGSNFGHFIQISPLTASIRLASFPLLSFEPLSLCWNALLPTFHTSSLLSTPFWTQLRCHLLRDTLSDTISSNGPTLLSYIIQYYCLQGTYNT